MVSFSVHSMMDIGLFPPLGYYNNAVVNIDGYADISVILFSVLFNIYPEVESLYHRVIYY